MHWKEIDMAHSFATLVEQPKDYGDNLLMTFLPCKVFGEIFILHRYLILFLKIAFEWIPSINSPTK